MSRQIPKLARPGIVALTLLAWFSISNHCLVGLVNSGSVGSAPLSCHTSVPTKPDGKTQPSPCCKVLRATLSISKDFPGFNPTSVVSLQYLDRLIARATEFDQGIHFEFDIDPPPGGSFAESVLQQSLLAHAPPIVA